MADDPIQSAIEGFRARLQAELDAQVRALTDHHQGTVERVRAESDAEAERRWSAKLDDVRAEWQTRLDQHVAAAHEEAARASAEEVSRITTELKQASEQVDRVRREMAEAVATFRRQESEAVEAERIKGAAALSQALAQAASQTGALERQRQQLEQALDAERARADQAVRDAEQAAAGRAQAEESRVQAEQGRAQAEERRAQADEIHAQTQQSLEAARATLSGIESSRAEERAWFESERVRLDGEIAALRADLDAARRDQDRMVSELRAPLDAEVMQLAEDLAEARRIGEADITRLTQELAEARRAAEAETARLAQELDAERARAQQLVRDGHATIQALESSRADEVLAQVRAAVDEEKHRAEEALARTLSEVDAEKRAAEESLVAARAEADVRTREAEQALAEARASIEYERRLGEQSRAEALGASEARRLEVEQALASVRHDLDAQARELDQARAALDAERGRPADVAPAPDLGALADALRSIESARSLSEMLAATARGAAAAAPRAALFLLGGEQLDEWAVSGVPALSPGSIAVGDDTAGLLGDVVKTGDGATSDGQGSAPRVPGFAALPAGRTALGVPLVLDGQTVAVLYADEGPAGEGRPGWQEAVRMLGSHAGACVASLTALRTAQALQFLATRTGASAGAGETADGSGARRYARLLLSEIKFYHEAAVRLGRQQGDLLARLGPEIDRAKGLYEERIPSSVGDRDAVFDEELVQTLAGGDARLLGTVGTAR